MTHIRATSGQRFVAYLIDFIILGVAVSLIALAINSMTGFQAEIKAAQDNVLDTFGAYSKLPNSANSEALSNAVFNYIPKLLISRLINAGIYLVLIICYFIVLPYNWNGKTLGRALMSLQVVDRNGNQPTLKTYIMREIVGTFLMYIVLSGIVTLISGIIALATHRSLVDMIGGTELEFVDKNRQTTNEDNFHNDFNQNDNYYNNYNNDNTVEPNFKDVTPKDENESDDSNDDYKVF